MKARVKATKEVVEVEPIWIEGPKGRYAYEAVEANGKVHSLSDLEPVESEGDDPNKENKELYYWEKLKHQYAGMAMQGMLIGWSEGEINTRFFVEQCDKVATALVEKLKEKSNGN